MASIFSVGWDTLITAASPLILMALAAIAATRWRLTGWWVLSAAYALLGLSSIAFAVRAMMYSDTTAIMGLSWLWIINRCGHATQIVGLAMLAFAAIPHRTDDYPDEETAR